MNKEDLLLLKKRGFHIVNVEQPLKVRSNDLIAIEIEEEIYLFSLTDFWVGMKNGWEIGEAVFKQTIPVHPK